jgi:hypothetical protein
MNEQIATILHKITTFYSNILYIFCQIACLYFLIFYKKKFFLSCRHIQNIIQLDMTFELYFNNYEKLNSPISNIPPRLP